MPTFCRKYLCCKNGREQSGNISEENLKIPYSLSKL